MIGTYHELLHLQSRYIKHPVTERKANTTNRKSRKSLVSVSSMVSVGLVVLLWPESLLLELLLMLMLLLLLRSRITTSLPGGCDIQCIFRAAAAVFYTCTEGRCFGACVICCCSIAFYHSIGCNLPTIHDYFKQTSRCIDRTTYSKLSFVKTDHRGINI